MQNLKKIPGVLPQDPHFREGREGKRREGEKGRGDYIRGESASCLEGG